MMKKLLTILFFGSSVLTAAAQDKEGTAISADTTKKLLTVETACGQCQFGLKGKGCTLAVRINGQSYFVDGTDIDSHGDAHANDGFCNKIRKAKVQGEVVNNRFKVTYFQLLPQTTKKEGTH